MRKENRIKNLVKMLKPASDEQKHILNQLKTNNVMVDAVAGSGKTTTNLHIANTFPNCKILLLTYNKDLKIDSRRRARELGITNMEVHSYHSFCVFRYYYKAYEDSGIIKIIKEDMEPQKPFHYDIILIDEIQDINSLYYDLVCKLICDNEFEDAKLCLLGDINQCINKWNKSDWRYMKFFDTLFDFNQFKWVQCPLSTSFRVTRQIANFINFGMLHKNRINAIKDGSLVRYIICKCFGSRPYEEVMYYISKGYSFDDFFILAPSLKTGHKKNSPVRRLANKLSKNNIPIYVPNSDEEELDNSVLKNKIVFSTFHQVKGRERKVVIVFNFDHSYFQFYAKDKDPYTCPNELYVAGTRSLEHLSVLHNFTNLSLYFLNMIELQRYCSVLYDTDLKIPKKKIMDNNYSFISVTDMTRHLPSKIMKECLKYIEITEEKEDNGNDENNEFINIPRKTNQGKLVESVSEITGIAIPSYFELCNTGKMSIFEDMKKQINLKKMYVTSTTVSKKRKKTSNEISFVFDGEDSVVEPAEIEETEEDKIMKEIKSLERMNMANLSPSDLLFIANQWNSFKTGYEFKLNQIKDYSWLSKEHLLMCLKRLRHKISLNGKYEVNFMASGHRELMNKKLKAFFDCLENNVLWEFKCVRSIKKEHFLQLAIYMYIHKMSLLKNHKLNRKYHIGDKIRIRYKFAILLGTIVEIDGGLYKVDCGFRDYQVSENQIVSIVEAKGFEYRLFNILTNKIYTLDSNLNQLKKMIHFLIKYKYFRNVDISDQQFLKKNTKIYNKYFE